MLSTARLHSITAAILKNNGTHFTIVYAVICCLIAMPIINGVYSFLYYHQVPSGGDPADHIFFIERIARTGSPLIPYLQFSDLPGEKSGGVGYYPSLLHLLLASLSYVISYGHVSFFAVLETVKSFMIIQYVIGISGFALLFKTIFFEVIKNKNTSIFIDRNDFAFAVSCYCLLALAFGVFVFSTSPIIKTFRDGGYGEIFSIWCIFPFYMYFLLQKRWVVSAALLAVIASSHNLSFIMTLIATFAYFIKLILNKDLITLRKSKVFFVSGLIFCIPAFVLFYLPGVITSLNSGTGINSGLGVPQSLSKSDIADQVTPGLYYFGVVGLIGLTALNYKLLGWVAAWLLLYFPLFNSSILAIRFSREISLPFGVIAGLFSALITYEVIFVLLEKRIKKVGLKNYVYRNMRFIQMLSCIVVFIIGLYLSFAYFGDRIKLYTDNDYLDYYSSAYQQANDYLATKRSSPDSGDSVLSFGVNPWVKPYLYGKFRVLEAIPKGDELTLSKNDRAINAQLLSVLDSPGSNESNQVLARHQIEYIIVSSLIPSRWYPQSFIDQDSKISLFRPDFDSSLVSLAKDFKGPTGEEIRIYSVNSTRPISE